VLAQQHQVAPRRAELDPPARVQRGFRGADGGDRQPHPCWPGPCPAGRRRSSRGRCGPRRGRRTPSGPGPRWPTGHRGVRCSFTILQRGRDRSGTPAAARPVHDGRSRPAGAIILLDLVGPSAAFDAARPVDERLPPSSSSAVEQLSGRAAQRSSSSAVEQLSGRAAQRSSSATSSARTAGQRSSGSAGVGCGSRVRVSARPRIACRRG